MLWALNWCVTKGILSIPMTALDGLSILALSPGIDDEITVLAKVRSSFVALQWVNHCFSLSRGDEIPSLALQCPSWIHARFNHPDCDIPTVMAICIFFDCISLVKLQRYWLQDAKLELVCQIQSYQVRAFVGLHNLKSFTILTCRWLEIYVAVSDVWEEMDWLGSYLLSALSFAYFSMLVCCTRPGLIRFPFGFRWWATSSSLLGWLWFSWCWMVFWSPRWSICVQSHRLGMFWRIRLLCSTVSLRT